MTETVHELQAIISERFGVPRDDLDPDRPMEDFGLDSLGVIELMFSIEDHYGIKVPEQGPEDARTLNQLALWVDSLRAAAGAVLQAS